MDRRSFLHGAIGTVALPHAARPWSFGSSRSHRDRLRAATDRAVRLERASQYASLQVILPGLLADASETEDLPEVLSQVHALHAWLAIKTGDLEAAERSATKAVEVAHGSLDALLIGSAMRCLGEVHMGARRYQLACDTAIEAGTVVGRARTHTPNVVAMQGASSLSAAMACARGGDRQGAHELFAVAEMYATDLGSDLTGETFFGPSNVDIHRVAIPVELDDPRTALRWADRIVLDLPSGLGERRGRYLLDVARAQVAIGDADEALATLLEAEQSAPEEVHTHRLTGETLSAIAERRTSRRAEFRALARRCGVEAEG